MPSSASYWRRVWRHFKRNTLAVIGLWIALALLLVALLADVLANDTPYYMVYQGTRYFPLLQSGLNSLGIVTLPQSCGTSILPNCRLNASFCPLSRIARTALICSPPLPNPQLCTGWGRTSWGVMSWLVSFTGHVFRCPLVSWLWGLLWGLVSPWALGRLLWRLG